MMKTGKLISLLAVAGLILTVAMSVYVKAAVPGDMDGDGDVDISDIVLAVGQYELQPGDPGYDPVIAAKADLAAPFGVVDIFDLVTIVFYYTG